MEVSAEPKLYQLFVTLLDGKTLTVNSTTPRFAAAELKRRISEATGIPAHLQRLLTGTRHLGDDSVVSGDGEPSNLPAVRVAARLVGGKGGFGSLLRGAGSKAWQKKTSNFDACRDMSGRRLRHVNAERRLEEWRAGEDERRLERIAEEFLKKNSKKGKKGAGDAEADKYVAKYREESERCISGVSDSVKAAAAAAASGVKRKATASRSDTKRLKIWMGKQKLAEDDSDDSGDEHENGKSTVSDNDNNRSGSSKDAEGSSDSVTSRKHDEELSVDGSSESGSEEEQANVVQESIGEFQGVDVLLKENDAMSEPVSLDENISQASEVDALQNEKEIREEPVVETVSTLGCGVESTSVEVGSSGEIAETETALNFYHINSASELEALGMERLKSELQDRGLKCGGTLQERAARLFLLKSTPLEKLPKKLLARK